MTTRPAIVPRLRFRGRETAASSRSALTWSRSRTSLPTPAAGKTRWLRTRTSPQSVKKLGSESHILWHIDLNKVPKPGLQAGRLGQQSGRVPAVRDLLPGARHQPPAGRRGHVFTEQRRLRHREQDSAASRRSRWSACSSSFPMPKVNLRPEPWVPGKRRQLSNV